MNHPKRTIIRGLVLSFGVAVGLISTAGAAWAQDAPTSSTSSGDAGIGDALYVERPAPRPDPANELRADTDPAPASTPAPAPVASAAPAVAPDPAPAAAPVAAAPARTATVKASASATSKPARATEVQGVQIVRSAVPTPGEGDQLAFTGVDNGPLVVLAAALLALGAVLVRAGRPRRTS